MANNGKTNTVTDVSCDDLVSAVREDSKIQGSLYVNARVHSILAKTDVITSHEDGDVSGTLEEGKAPVAGLDTVTENATTCAIKKRRCHTGRATRSKYGEARPREHIRAKNFRRRQLDARYAALRDLIPSSFRSRVADQAATLDTAVNMVRNLETVVKHLEKKIVERSTAVPPPSSTPVTPESPSPIAIRRSSNDAALTGIDHESGASEQLRAVLKSQAGDVEVQITQTDCIVTVFTVRRGTGQVTALLEVLQDLQLSVRRANVSGDSAHALYTFCTNISPSITAKVIASRILDSLVALQVKKEGRTSLELQLEGIKLATH